MGLMDAQGLLDDAEKAVDMSKVNAMQTEIKMQIAKTMLINDRDATIKQIIERLEKQEIITDSNAETGQVKTQPDGYVYEIKQNNERNWEVIYIGIGEIEKIQLSGEIEIGSTTDLETWTNKDIVIEITWPENAEYYKKQVSTNSGNSWKEYTGAITIEENTEIIAKVEDSTGKELKRATLEISKIDKVKPTVTITPNGGIGYVMPTEGNATIKTTLTAIDEGGSELKTLQYAWSQSTQTEPTSWINFTDGQEVLKTDITTAGTWYLWTNVIDTAGNRATNIKTSEGFVVSANTEANYLIKLTPDYTDWTSNDITVTATYGANLIPNSLTCTGMSGTDYIVNGTTSVAVKNNNQTVTATAVDKVGNVVTATLNVTKIDKNSPTVTATAESINIMYGDTNKISDYFTYSENGGAPITSVEYIDVSNNNQPVENTNTLSAETHVIRCTAIKETGKSAYAEITIFVESMVDENGLAKENVTIKPSEESNVQIVIPTGFAPAILEGSNSTTSLTTESGKAISIMPYAEWKNITVEQINQGIVVVNNAITYTDSVPDFEEYVWVPIPEDSDFDRVAWNGPYFNGSSYPSGTHPLSSSPESGKFWEETDTEMVNSVIYHKGFYIGRYEASKDSTSTIAQSKRGQTVWTSVSLTNAITYTKNNPITNIHVIYGIEWDSTLKWLIGNAKITSLNAIMTEDNIQANSVSWGNYSGTKRNTGYSETWKANNIYDLSGNVWEKTQEDISGGGYGIPRGGDYSPQGHKFPAACRSIRKDYETSSTERFSYKFLFRGLKNYWRGCGKNG